jgi:uncharacterized membrane protein YfcA
MSLLLLANLLLGAVAGFFAGLFGIGGGIIIVPVLVWLLTPVVPSESLMLVAIATSLATISLTSLASTYSHYCQARVLWHYVLRLTPGILIGASGGVMIAEQIPAAQLRLIFAVFLGMVGVQMLKSTPITSSKFQIKINWLDYPVGIIIGIAAAILGIGGGTLTVPYLVKRGVAINYAVAVSSACGFPIAIAGSLSFIHLSVGQTGLPPYSLGYIYLPAFAAIALGSLLTAALGAKWAHRLPAAKLKRYFSSVIFIMAIKLLIHAS